MTLAQPGQTWTATIPELNHSRFSAKPIHLAYFPCDFFFSADIPESESDFLDSFHATEPCDLPGSAVRVRSVVLPGADPLIERLRTDIPALQRVTGYDDLVYNRFDLDKTSVWLSPAGDANDIPGGRLVIVRDTDTWWAISEATAPHASRRGAILARELLRLEVLRRGGIIIHSSAVVRNGSTVMFCGDAYSGKTTLSLSMALYGAAFVSGDRTAIFSHSGLLWATGQAVAVRARKGTIDGLGISERMNGRTLRRSHPSKIIFTQSELETIIGVRTAVGAPLSTIIFTERISGSPMLTDITNEKAADLLQHQRIATENDWQPGWLTSTPVDQMRASSIVSTARCLNLRWNPEHGMSAAVTKEIAELLDAG